MVGAIDGGDLTKRFQSRKFGDEAADVIRELILSGQISAGERLNEVALSQSLGISRSPIREALNALAGEGLITHIAGRGAFVPDFDREHVRQLGEARLSLECTAARLAAGRCTDAELDEIDNLLRVTEGTLQQSADQYPYTLDFHSLVLRCSGNRVIEQLGSSVNVQLRLARVVSGQHPGRAREALHEHRAIYEAMRSREPRVAGMAMFEHLSHALSSAERSLGLPVELHADGNGTDAYQSVGCEEGPPLPGRGGLSQPPAGRRSSE